MLIVRDRTGNLYGTLGTGSAAQFGSVYRLDTLGNFATVYEFTGGSDGSYPAPELMIDPAGHLIGTTANGGVNGTGAVFEIKPD